jgi:hypothetical protein
MPVGEKSADSVMPKIERHPLRRGLPRIAWVCDITVYGLAVAATVVS